MKHKRRTENFCHLLGACIALCRDHPLYNLYQSKNTTWTYLHNRSTLH